MAATLTLLFFGKSDIKKHYCPVKRYNVLGDSSLYCITLGMTGLYGYNGCMGLALAAELPNQAPYTLNPSN
jgi:hypothetical protein